MSCGVMEAPRTELVSNRADRLRRFMGAYWLRPENAFWMALRSEVLGPIPWSRPSLDLSCGDGVFAFLHGDGRFHDDFDVFRGSEASRTRDNETADMFDHVDARYQPAIIAPTRMVIDVGADWKPNLLTKAGRLGVYEELVLHDNNKPLPFDSASFETVYCNSAYWVHDIDSLLSEICRITAPGGSVLLQVKLSSMLDYTLEPFRSVLGDRFLEIIGRGRTASWPTVGDRATWERRFARAGLAVEEAAPFITQTHAHLWDVGLRPIAPMLIELANGVRPESRRRVKQHWVDLFCELCTPICHSDFDLGISHTKEPAEILYRLAPAS